MTTVSVLMTCYNHEAFVGDAIESVINQSFTDWELLIADDASQDRSATIITEYAQTDARIKPCLHTENRGKSACLNELLGKAQGDYLALLDSDDYWLTPKLEKQLDHLQRDKTVGVVHTNGLLIDSRPFPPQKFDTAWPEDVAGKLFSDIHRRPGTYSGRVFQELLQGNFVFYASAVVRRHYLGNIRFETDLRRSIDWYFFIELAQKCDFAYIDEPLAAYRIHGSNLQNIASRSEETIAPLYFALNKYGAQMSRRTRARHWRSIGNFYRHNGDYQQSRVYLLRALRHNPFDHLAWAYLLLSLTNGNTHIDTFLRKINK